MHEKRPIMPIKWAERPETDVFALPSLTGFHQIPTGQEDNGN